LNSNLLPAVVSLHEKYGKGSYATLFPDNTLVPWRTLSIKDYLEYAEGFERGLIPLAAFEDEIFKKCVLDKSFIRLFPTLKAGIVSTVVNNIWEASCPSSAEGVNYTLNMARAELDGKQQIIHEFVSVISIAFPYKPEEIYAMDYQTMINTLALAERKLIQLGIRQSPIEIIPAGQEEQPEPQRPKLDAKEIWDMQQRDLEKARQEALKRHQDISKKKIEPISQEKQPDEPDSPILKYKPTHGVNFKEEGHDVFAVGSGWEMRELGEKREQMVEEAQEHYKDVIQALERRRKLKAGKK